MSEATATRDPQVTDHARAKPWHKEPWPWILMAGPAAVVVAGTITAWLAIATADGLVADDYYRRGLAVNQELRRDEAAAERGVEVVLEARAGVLRARLAMRGEAPTALFVRLVHPTRAGEDLRLRMALVAPGVYEAAFAAAPGERWRVVVEDPRGEWRVVKERL